MKPTGRPNGRPHGSKQSAETREKLSRIAKARWQDPAFRAAQLPRLEEMRTIFVIKCAERRQNRPPPKPVGRPKGSKNSPEAYEKTRQATIKRWQDPEYRKRMSSHLRALAPEALAVARKARFSPPLRGTPEFRWYEKVRKTLGPDAARSLQW